MANKVRFGVSNARYALKTATGYGEWKRIPGAVQIQLEPQESQNDFYADNENYFQQPGSASDQVTIELADLPDTAKVDLLGWREVNGNLGLPVNYKPNEFVLGFQVEGDETTLRVNVFGGKLTRASETHSTKEDTTEPETQSYEGTFSGAKFVVDTEEEPWLYYTTTSDKTDYATWWDEVKMPGTPVAEEGSDAPDPDNP